MSNWPLEVVEMLGVDGKQAVPHEIGRQQLIYAFRQQSRRGEMLFMSVDARAIRQEKASGLGLVPVWLWLGIGVYAVTLACGDRLLKDLDTYWQISVGQWIIDHATLPRTDIYSFTKTGEPWTSSSWLAQVLLAGSYDLAGGVGPVVLASASIAMAFALLTWILGRRIPAPMRSS